MSFSPVIAISKFRAFIILGLCGLALNLSACSKSETSKSDASVGTQSEKIVTEAQKKELSAMLKAYRDVANKRDFKAIFDMTIPPELVKVMAKDFEVSKEELKVATVQFMESNFKAIKSFEYTIDEDNIIYKKLDDGTLYALIDTQVEMQMVGQSENLKVEDQNVGLYLNGRWYLVRISEPESALTFKRAYPKFKDISFKTMKIQ